MLGVQTTFYKMLQGAGKSRYRAAKSRRGATKKSAKQNDNDSDDNNDDF
jgi:hypothetical protein